MALAQCLPLVDQTGLIHDAGWVVMHPAWGVGFFILVNWAVAAEQRWRLKSSAVPRLIPALASVGLMSYSLYLTHSFVLMHWYWFGFTKFHVLTISLLILTPLSVAFAWLFFRVCERPFMISSVLRNRTKAGNAGVVEKAVTLAREVA
jgi:peptidoglycan/LPS O-acetylase OafA/YrhL